MFREAINTNPANGWTRTVVNTGSESRRRCSSARQSTARASHRCARTMRRRRIPRPDTSRTIRCRRCCTASSASSNWCLRTHLDGQRIGDGAQLEIARRRAGCHWKECYFSDLPRIQLVSLMPCGGQAVSVTAVRIVPGARYVRLVGATVNEPDAVPQPGAAVYTVLSESFDGLP